MLCLCLLFWIVSESGNLATLFILWTIRALIVSVADFRVNSHNHQHNAEHKWNYFVY
jgi:hypothetical protein